MINFNISSKKDLNTFLKDPKFKNILIISGKTSYEASGSDKIMKKLLINKNIKYFFKKNFYPEFGELKKIIREINIFCPDLIIAIGGGSVIDYAKIANVLTSSKNLKYEILNSSYNIKKKFTKLVAIPTTAGSGAEVTTNAVIYINKIKHSIEGDKLRPDFFFLIPELVLGASNKIKSSAGFDAIAQAMESLISKKSNFKSVAFAKKSLKISLKYYLDFLSTPNKENSYAMCLASNLAGEAISISKTTAPHAVSYPFTAIYNVSHGHAVSLTLDKFFKFNFKNIKNANCNFNLNDRYKIIFDITKSDDIESFNRYLKNIKKEANLESDFIKLGIDLKKDYSKIISGINIMRLSNNPVELKKKDLKEIILKDNV